MWFDSCRTRFHNSNKKAYLDVYPCIHITAVALLCPAEQPEWEAYSTSLLPIANLHLSPFKLYFLYKCSDVNSPYQRFLAISVFKVKYNLCPEKWHLDSGVHLCL